MKKIRATNLALLSTLVWRPGLCLAAGGPHCAVDPTRIALLGHGMGGLAPSSGETSLPKPVLPPGNIARARLSATTMTAVAVRAASTPSLPELPVGTVRLATHLSAARPPVAAAARSPVRSVSGQRSLPAADPPSSAPPLPIRTPAPASAPASRMVDAAGPANLPLQAVPRATIAASPALRRIASKGAKLYALGTSHGMMGVFARNGRYFQVFYITPDGRAAIAGIMWNDAGRNITVRQVRDVPDLTPTVRLGPVGDRRIAHHAAYRVPGGAGSPTSPGSLPSGSLFQALAISDHGTIGRRGAPRLWMFMDPLCSYSNAAMRQLMPEVRAGRLRVSVVPLSILDYEDHGMSTPEAKIMLSQPGKLMATDWIDRGLADERAASGASRKLAFNMEIARAIDLKGTPTFLWRTDTGGFGRSNGLPSDLSGVIASIRKPS